MNESYAEASVKKLPTAKDGLIKGGLIALIIFVLVFLTPKIGFFSITIALLIGLVCFFIFPNLSIEYEYIFCDGQIDFDKIPKNGKRKTLLRIDFEKIEVVAPVGSHELDSYNRNESIKVKDFSSLNPEARVYAAIVREDANVSKVLFEPSDKMINCMKQKAPRKVFEY